ncbi:MAG: glucoamylase family protein [Candidatus Omnitrophota bacterium]
MAKGSYKLLLILLFCVSLFIGASFAEVEIVGGSDISLPAYDASKLPEINKAGLIVPLMLIDYDLGTLYTSTGGLSGGDEGLPGTTFAVVTADDNFTKGNSGYSLMLDYNVSGLGEYSFYWIKLGKKKAFKQDATETLDLRKYNYLSFWIKSLKGGERIKVELHQDIDNDGIFIFDRDVSSFVYANTLAREGNVTEVWQKIVIPLKNFTAISDFSKMHELVFVFENVAGNTTGAVYIDDIMFGWRPEEVLSMRGSAPPLAAPIESTFMVNDVAAEQCFAFTQANRLIIGAQSAEENPFLESVGFEYTTDGGSTWRTIGSDYGVSGNLYKVAWYPENGAELFKYQVRAVATDMRGAKSYTGALIDCGVKPLTDDEFLNLIEKKAFEFFYDHQSFKTGLFADTSGGGDASIASTGFGLTALCVGAERGWITRFEAVKRSILAIDAFLPRSPGEKPLAEGKDGFFYHFLDMHTGKRAGKSEISTVDTAILVLGAITAGEYFGGEVKEKAEKLYGMVQWGKFISDEEGPWKNIFSMGWSPERGYLDSYWDYYTDEVILISLLAIGSPTHPVSPEAFYAWSRHKSSYGAGKPFIYSWHGALFSYQYAHVWFDFRNIVDRDGINWFENSTRATLANRQFCIDNKERSKTFGENTWGITSMDRPTAYTMHFGTPPTGSGEAQYGGTISPTGPAGSIVFTPFQSLSALKYMYLNYPRLWGKYGMRDSFNLDTDWYAPTYYGIGEAMYTFPVENFRSELIWKTFMKSEHIKRALERAGFTRK